MHMKINAVYIIYLQFTGSHFTSAFDIMKAKVLSKIEFVNWRWITIDNSISGDVEIVKNQHFHLISGDNSAREFSGFDKGVKYLNRLNPRPNDIVIFANDTFHRSYGHQYLDSVTTEMIEKNISENGMLGYVDSFPHPVKGFNHSFSSWVRTSFFVQNYSLVNKITPFAIPMDRSRVFGDSADEFFKSNDILSENYKTYLKTWLFDDSSQESEFKESWHSKESLKESNFRKLQEKCWCILCEQNLSARTQDLGIPVFDIKQNIGQK